jgi:hypothetical protein
MPFKSKVLLVLSFLPFIVGACDDPQPVNTFQDIGNAAWRDNSSLLAFAEQRNFVSTGAFVYKLFETGSDGKLGRQLADEVTNEGVPFIHVSADGQRALTLLSGTLYRLDLTSGIKTLLTTNVTRVYASSPDLKYVLLTHAVVSSKAKTVSLLDVAGTPRSVKEWLVTGLKEDQGFWVRDDKIVLTRDTVGNHSYFVSIYDTTGAELKSYPNAQTPPRSSAYESNANLLFVKNVLRLEQINLETGSRTDIADMYVNADARGNTLAYIVNEGSKNRIYLRNIMTGETTEVADDAFRYVILSPEADKLAYLVETRDFFNELKVINVTTP